ncbi:hypothetical protein FB192DRAFT_1288873 [Mucor lusitanicus]|uniref:Uncharacterized protein n=1 Tax=Mucor circinelloides f. lusitanicus TaxID=29924 RepID=A0A8H4BAS8_MUCCL|nr:hypothetical protein FB192DRAFT_1288873 [Mucor lusitanicus]
MQGCIIYYHTLVFAQCVFSLRTLGLSQVDLIYHGILIMAFVYQVFLYMDCLRQRNLTHMYIYTGVLLVIWTGIQTIQHMMFEKVGCHNKLLHMSVIISNTSLIFQDTVDENVSNIKPFEYAILVLVPICFVVMAGCIVKLYSLFKWNHYKSHTLSPSAAGNSGDDDDTRLRTTLMAWSILTGLLKLDFFFLFAYAAQLVPSSMMEYTVPPYESVVVFCASVLAFLLATQGTRTENIKAMWLFSLVLLGSVGYLGYRLFTFGIPRDVTRDPYLLTRYNLLFTTLTLTLLVIMTLCTCLVCIKNVSFHKVHISDTYHCTCPTCFAVSSTLLLPQEEKQQREPSVYHSSNCSIASRSIK